MNKTEEFLTKKFIDTNLRVESNIPGISEDYFHLVDLLDEYAQRVNRERTLEFLRRFFGIDPNDKDVNAAYNKYFNHQKPKDAKIRHTS